MKYNKLDRTKIEEMVKTMTYGDIAKHFKVSIASVAGFCRRNKIKRPLKWGHLHLKVEEYYRTHSKEETTKRFKISNKEFKSIMTYVYRKGIGVRKDHRVKTEFNSWQELALMSGIFERQEIAKKLERGSYHAIKDRIGKYKINGKYLNGLRLQQVDKYFSNLKVWKTRAGPTRFTLVPWVELEDKLDSSSLPKLLKKAIKALARFQRFIHKTEYNHIVKRNITKMIGTPNMSQKKELENFKKDQTSDIFDTKKVIGTLESLMERVTSSRVDPSTVNAACNCADKITDILRLHLDVERLKIALKRAKDI
jgi:hypothetical protein